ncbi:head scaffolding protein [Ralstonia phage RSB1]|uniref:Scaffolding-like protein n=1 Tax=Ralstonia phage RSB1 TaxID=551790 RepID=B5BTW7_9CAUD|nr:head scaffolding protein [Ralstonia phage RSB1]BAG70389.1 scaffolding-like protein [Ralstonia phage RSB1]
MTEVVAATGATDGNNVATPAAGTGVAVPGVLPAGAQPATPAAGTGQPAAPGATPAANPAGAETPADGVFGPAVSYQSTGHAGLDMAVNWLGSLGIDYDTSPEAQAAYNGDFSLLRALLQGKGVQGAEAYLTLAETALKGIQGEKAAKEQAHIAEINGYATDLLGGIDSWNETLAWASANVEGDEAAGINAALDSGGIQAQAMMLFLQQQHRSQPGTSYGGPANVASHTAGGNGSGQSSFTPLSPQEYGRATAELAKQLRGQDITKSPEYAKLQQRRALYRG